MNDITTVSYPILDSGIIVRNKFPESRLQSDCVLAYCNNSVKG